MSRSLPLACCLLLGTWLIPALARAEDKPAEKPAVKAPAVKAEEPPAAKPAAIRPSVFYGVDVKTDVEYGKAGDKPLLLDVITPKRPSEKPRPAIVWIHGGGWSGGNKSSGVSLLTQFVSSGDYVGFTIAYRFSQVAPFPAQIHDCKAAIRWIRANAKTYNIDPDRIGVWGSSAGGHLVSLLGTSGDVKDLDGSNGTPDQSSSVKCVVNFCGPTNLVSFIKDHPELPKWVVDTMAKLLGGSMDTKLELAKAGSPITYVTKNDPPFIHFHGDKDDIVPFDQAEQFHKALKDAGASTILIRIEGGGHGFGGKEVRDRVTAFLEKHLLGKDVEISEKSIVVPPPAAKPTERKPFEREPAERKPVERKPVEKAPAAPVK